jgi:hypothetical protein
LRYPRLGLNFSAGHFPNPWSEFGDKRYGRQKDVPR